MQRRQAAQAEPGNHLGFGTPATQGDAVRHRRRRSISEVGAPLLLLAPPPCAGLLAGRECMMTLSTPRMVFVFPVPARQGKMCQNGD